MIWACLYLIEDFDIYASVSPQYIGKSAQLLRKPSIAHHAKLKKESSLQHQEEDKSTSLCSGRYSMQHAWHCYRATSLCSGRYSMQHAWHFYRA